MVFPFFYFFIRSPSADLEPERLNRLMSLMAQTTCFAAEQTLLGTQLQHSRFMGSFSPKTPFFGPFLANRTDSSVVSSMARRISVNKG